MTNPTPTLSEIVLKALKLTPQKLKFISYIFIILIVICGGWYYYKNYIKLPQELKAQDAMYQAENFFRRDSFNLALNGQGTAKGFLNIIKNFNGTKSADLSTYYAGICYLNLGQFKNAVDYLKKYQGEDPNVQAVALGALADAQSELKQNDDAINNYLKASNLINFQDNLAGEYLFKAALLSEVIGKNDQALDYYQKLKSDFPRSEKGAQADKYIARLTKTAF
ncbi:MAG: tetratricopeptide repeat protein [Alphaproteobacteria bacterium]|nr:tetratricopeptide repeat protein [Alphaproteobacteria bacterium]